LANGIRQGLESCASMLKPQAQTRVDYRCGYVSHQHFHRREPFRSVLQGIASDLRLPLREEGWIHYIGGFYGQGSDGDSLPSQITTDAFLRLATLLPDGTSELSCHPAAAADAGGAYNESRVLEFETLCNPQLRTAINRMGIELVTF